MATPEAGISGDDDYGNLQPDGSFGRHHTCLCPSSEWRTTAPISVIATHITPDTGLRSPRDSGRSFLGRNFLSPDQCCVPALHCSGIRHLRQTASCIILFVTLHHRFNHLCRLSGLHTIVGWQGGSRDWRRWYNHHVAGRRKCVLPNAVY